MMMKTMNHSSKMIYSVWTGRDSLSVQRMKTATTFGNKHEQTLREVFDWDLYLKENMNWNEAIALWFIPIGDVIVGLWIEPRFNKETICSKNSLGTWLACTMMWSRISSTILTSNNSSICCSSRLCVEGGLLTGKRNPSKVSARSAQMLWKSVAVKDKMNFETQLNWDLTIASSQL